MFDRRDRNENYDKIKKIKHPNIVPEEVAFFEAI